MELSGKVALITGASSGIGKATARAFAAAGSRLALLSRSRESLQRVVDEIARHGVESIILPVDLTDAEHCRRAVAQTVDHFGRLDVLVNAAGIIATGSISSTPREAWDLMLRLNLTAVFVMMQEAVPFLKATGGNIVNVSSVTGTRAFPNVLAYCVSKAGVDQLTRCAALDLAPFGVRVNAVNPGVVVTNLHRASGMTGDQYQAFLEHSKTTHPLGRVGTPEEIADAILYLASPRAGWITGVTFNIDGGRQLTCAR
ncbi:MAG: SDR family oxidoreductase [candidate division KSB1 bacterium]|nr:SDR family oxidoreductase [candidate division KSB1 bacterium]MDZ7273837.1 SDR family oxidoreductase [candidate division KSB1 bacterium]MDZ7285993.1 SDR family oxidoreductase [candidate division KSB1 bacterium]MDZ7299025.1 SDR family oxidoreductase [candidate division KSB1 bacterium]MDZ7308004.1 SDR family oxidoreductase [candidate division KSB1 bacterium]